MRRDCGIRRRDEKVEGIIGGRPDHRARSRTACNRRQPASAACGGHKLVAVASLHVSVYSKRAWGVADAITITFTIKPLEMAIMVWSAV